MNYRSYSVPSVYEPFEKTPSKAAIAIYKFLSQNYNMAAHEAASTSSQVTAAYTQNTEYERIKKKYDDDYAGGFDPHSPPNSQESIDHLSKSAEGARLQAEYAKYVLDFYVETFLEGFFKPTQPKTEEKPS